MAGQASGALTPAQVSKELHGLEGTPVIITIERDGTYRRITVKKRACCAQAVVLRSLLVNVDATLKDYVFRNEPSPVI